MSPGRFDESVVRAKLETLKEMLRGIASLPLTSLEELTADPRMVAAGESYGKGIVLDFVVRPLVAAVGAVREVVELRRDLRVERVARRRRSESSRPRTDRPV